MIQTKQTNKKKKNMKPTPTPKIVLKKCVEAEGVMDM